MFTEMESKKIMKQILEGLKYLHENRIMHRDLKLSNIMFKKENTLEHLQILDFGLAQRLDVTKYLFKRCGTPGYIAPEIILLGSNKKYSEKCDIFSAGVIFYHL